LAYLEGKQRAEATAEFEKITSRPHLVRNNVVFPLARAAVEEARARAGSTCVEARIAPLIFGTGAARGRA
jgi:hypothetical protein